MPASFNFDTSEIDKFEKKVLQKAKAIALPVAIQNTLNTLAFDAMRESKETIREDFINRNRFTERSVRVEKSKTLKISDMVATVGSGADYMLAQEEGDTKTSGGKHGLRIPTGGAAGQTQLYPRLKPVRKKYRRGQIKLANETGRINAQNRKQFILMSIRVASLRGQSPYIFLPFGGGRAGLYKVIPKGSSPSASYKRGKKKFSRKFKWGRPKGKPGMEKLMFIHSFAHRTIKIPETKWLSKNVEDVAGTMAVTFIKEADRAFDRFMK